MHKEMINVLKNVLLIRKYKYKYFEIKFEIIRDFKKKVVFE